MSSLCSLGAVTRGRYAVLLLLLLVLVLLLLLLP
jgi:hypothetical protein